MNERKEPQRHRGTERASRRRRCRPMKVLSVPLCLCASVVNKMDLNAEVAVLEKNRRTLTLLGILGTALFVVLIVGYIYSKGGLAELLALPFNNMGDFLAGAFAPLAFWWLVLGYRMQALELEQNSKALVQQAAEMKNAVEQATRQSDALLKNQDYVRCDIINSMRSTIDPDLNELARKMLEKIIVLRPECKPAYLEALCAYSAGSRECFVSAALSMISVLEEFIARDASVTGKYAISYIKTFEYLFNFLRREDQGVTTAYFNRDFGMLYSFLHNVCGDCNTDAELIARHQSTVEA